MYPSDHQSGRADFLAHPSPFNSRQQFAGWYCSDDPMGNRCFWDGGLSRGLRTWDVPFSARVIGTGRPSRDVSARATGLWNMFGEPIPAPEAFLNSLPCCPIDGVLVDGGPCLAALGSPPFPRMMLPGYVRISPIEIVFRRVEIEQWVMERVGTFEDEYRFVDPGGTFNDELLFLRGALETQNDQVYLVRHWMLPNDEIEARRDLIGRSRALIRNPKSEWTPGKTNNWLEWRNPCAT